MLGQVAVVVLINNNVLCEITGIMVVVTRITTVSPIMVVSDRLATPGANHCGSVSIPGRAPVPVVVVVVVTMMVLCVVLSMNRSPVVAMTIPTYVKPNERDIKPINVRVLMSFTMIVMLCMNQYNVVVVERDMPTYVKRNEMAFIHDNVPVLVVAVVPVVVLVVTEPIVL